MLRSLFTTLACCFLALTPALRAQTVRWEPAGGTLAFNQPNELRLIFDQCQPDTTFALPAIAGLTVSQPPDRAESTAFSVINGKATRSRTVTLTYRVRPTEHLNVTLPAFQADTDKGRLPVPAATFTIGEPTVGQSNLSLDRVTTSTLTLPSGNPWAGQVFPLIYSLNVARRYFYQLGSEPEWDSAPLSVEPWSKPEPTETVVGNEARVTIIYRTRGYAKAPGAASLKPINQLVNLSTGNSGFTVFSRPNLEQFSISSRPVSITVRPLPTPAPAGFKGAVGQFTLNSQVVPATATVGEPITWTLTLDGTGNWPDIAGLPARSVSKDFRVVQPQAKRVNKNDSLFEASITEDIVLIPTKPGTYTLGPIAYTIFNPATGAYENLSTQPVTLQVAPAAGQPAASSAPSSPAIDSLPNVVPSPETPAPAPAAITPIPRDPLPPGRTALAPFSGRAVLIGLLSALLVPLLTWLSLALRRARQTDPSRVLREARLRLSETLARLTSADHSVASAVGPWLQAWQRDAAVLWRLPQAVPTPASFPATDNARPWSALWTEADRTLYGASPLPADWTTRAHTALAAHPVPAFTPFQLFLPRNLLPLLVLVATVLTLPSASAADGRDAYAKTDWPAAEKAWRDTLATAPADWTAHHNLALTLLQQNRPGEAAGHALAAFVQQPQNPSVRWHLGYAFKTAGTTPPELAPFLADAPTASLARLASPTRWQLLLVASGWLGAVATALTLHAAYARRTPSSASSSFVLRHSSFRRALAAVALLLALAAGVSLRTYGLLAQPPAVVVVTPTKLRSIPSDLETPKSTPLGIGVIATQDKTFLGWTRLTFPDGQTGWTRTEAIVPLWK